MTRNSQVLLRPSIGPVHNGWIHGPMGGAVYQRHGCAQWVAIERLDGFA